jgi:AcrR family transcriptional regulator
MKPIAQKTYDKLLSSAVQLFIEQGYQETSIEDICQHAEVGRSTFYKYFSCKEELAYDLFTEDLIFSPKQMAWVLDAKTPTERLVRAHICYLRYPSPTCGPDVYLAQCKYMVSNPGPNIFSEKRYSVEIFLSLAEQAINAGEMQVNGDLSAIVSLFMTYQFGLEVAWTVSGHRHDYASNLSLAMHTYYGILADIPLEEYIRNCMVEFDNQ